MPFCPKCNVDLVKSKLVELHTDDSNVLFTREQLEQCICPLGEHADTRCMGLMMLTKERNDARKLARETTAETVLRNWVHKSYHEALQKKCDGHEDAVIRTWRKLKARSGQDIEERAQEVMEAVKEAMNLIDAGATDDAYQTLREILKEG